VDENRMMRQRQPEPGVLDNRLTMPPPGQVTPRGAILEIPGVGRLRLLHATRSDRQPNHGARQEHRHVLWHAVVYVQGTGTCLVDGAVVAVRAPFLVLTSPDQPHSFGRLPGEDTVYSELTFAPERPVAGAPDWSDLLSVWSGQPCAVPAYGPLSAAGADALHELATRAVRDSSHAAGGVLLQVVLVELLASIHRLLVIDRLRAEPDDPLAEAKRFIERHAEDPIDLAAVARIAGCSPKHLGRAFAARFGQPPMRYRTQVLMARAAVLLRTSDAPVAEIAARLGYGDWRFFSRCFARQHGASPAHWRRTSG
jgi:AraC-like DNA-binding protein